jgi:hypothetical protein
MLIQQDFHSAELLVSIGVSRKPSSSTNKTQTARPKRDGGRWGVAQGCNCRSILDAIATIIQEHQDALNRGIL